MSTSNETKHKWLDKEYEHFTLDGPEKFVEENSSDPLPSAKIFGTCDFLTKSAKNNY